MCPCRGIFGWLFHGKASDHAWSFRPSSFNTSHRKKKTKKRGNTLRNFSDSHTNILKIIVDTLSLASVLPNVSKIRYNCYVGFLYKIVIDVTGVVD